MLDILFDNPNEDILFSEDNKLLRPPNFMQSDVYTTNTQKALPNGGPLYLISSVINSLDHTMLLGNKCPCPGIDYHKTAVEEVKEIAQTQDFSFIKPIIKAFNLDIDYDKNNGLLNCYKVANFIRQSYYSDPGFDKSEYKDKWGKGSDMWKKLKQCYSVGSVALQGKNNMIKTSGTPLMSKIISSLKERINYEQNKKEKKIIGPGDRLAQVYNLYVGHGTNQQSLLTILNNFDRECIIENYKKGKTILNLCRLLPGDSSTINFELYSPEEENSEFRIRVRLNDEYLKIDPKSDSTIFSLPNFESIVGKNLVPNWKEVCKISTTSKQKDIQKYDTTTLWFVYFICAIDVGFLVLILTFFIQSYINRKRIKSFEELRESNINYYGRDSTFRKSQNFGSSFLSGSGYSSYSSQVHSADDLEKSQDLLDNSHRNSKSSQFGENETVRVGGLS